MTLAATTTDLSAMCYFLCRPANCILVRITAAASGHPQDMIVLYLLGVEDWAQI